ncbi:MAG: MaoC family dehydratase [Nitrospina sp.]|jgi:acyl dehydratase|nr:MaoC family dehydratase [Nitrospina sp.]MBT3414103.1 MaoC family dehydratase [Nitrospina sp.]MBT3856449.1 MaoC family dehydratase [Nitrospina sp.]MBT4105646.1 MaoC family dehydratase [Nitrospina sp.]MBT4389450.1 MaoC family dehydratase [Nitrospina sp.]
MLDFDAIQIGREASLRHTVTEKDVQTFAELTGDTNPLHMDAGFASKAGFKKRVVHGMLTASFISTVVGMQLPGPGALYLSQELNFKKTVAIDDTIQITAIVIQKVVSSQMLVLKIAVTNQNAENVLTGTARVLCPPLNEGTINDE